MSTPLIGYGAYNLCFDRLLGRETPTGPDFFQYIRGGGWPVNHVKVIVFCKSTQEGLVGDRAIPLYTAGRINSAFLANLRTLVARARQTGFTVQICLFSYHSVARSETPENLPAVLNPAQWTGCARLTNFFTLKNPAVVAEQVKLVQAVVGDLRGSGNLGPHVIFELANELRADICGATNRAVNCDMVPWLNRMAKAVRDAAGTVATRITTSTGVHVDSASPQFAGDHNERIVFDKRRPADGCSQAPLAADLFDLHAGQWEALGDHAGALRLRVRARLQSYGYPAPAVIINDDGVDDATQRTTANVERWAAAALRQGFGYASKQQYPPHPIGFDEDALNALRRAYETVFEAEDDDTRPGDDIPDRP